VPIENSA